MTKARQLVGLDLIRFGAASMVMAFHLAHGTGWQRATDWGWVGVEVFFVLSGFVIAYSAAETSAGRFLRGRIVRLMPSVWLCGSLTAVVWMLHGGLPHLGERYLRTMVLWPAGPWVDGVYWTLPIEIAFYALIFGVLALGAFRHVEWLFGVLAAASGAYWFARLLATRFHLTIAFPADALASELLLLHGCYFALGGMLWAAARSGWTIWRAVVAMVSVATGVVQIIFMHNGMSAGSSFWPPALVWLAALALIILAVWRSDLFDHWLGRRASAIRLVGLATYPLYLLHDDMGSMLSNALPLPRPLAASTAATVAIIAALAVARWVEPAIQAPLRSALSRFPSRRAALSMQADAGSAAARD